MRTVVVVGTSLAGLRAAQELRARGYSGRLVLVGREPHRPYDRPPLSKDFLLGKVRAADLELGDADDLLALEAQWHLGVSARRLDTATGEVVLSGGTRVAADGVVVATGATAKTLAGTEELLGVHTLRTLDDALALRAELTAGARVVVIGAGFVGAEVASACHTLGCAVTVVEAASVPLAGVLGARMGAVAAGLHGDNGVRLLAGTGVAGVTAAGGRVTGVSLADGSWLPADVVVAGIGCTPATDWLAGSGIAVDNGVCCDRGGVTSNPSVVAVGDVAGGEHWTTASEQPRVAVRNLLAGATVEHHTRPGYFWSDQYGTRIQFAGTAGDGAEVRVVDGDTEERSFVATYHRDGVLTGVLAMNRPRPFLRLRKRLEHDAAIVQLG
ncbi:NAD(P)/FAD-dependent oxidoreductase [Prauserella flavalba]|uniref:Pyridine nucleotide-disulfide oxidoreductase n=1 Tax=Prauserella flavalba TaxID=1477506 RepID=A0A318LXI8_9PSEU|nr:FAD-dependent oxidoreductase [Prauserella flavalba]PXY33800.1 pyridine nucleotide-disulfide oxidoreductase [Prauserella flavalba]